MTLNEYQAEAMTTCMESCNNPLYMLMNLQGEVGELSGKIAKLIRSGMITFNDNKLDFTPKALESLRPCEVDALEYGIKAEIGDVAWQLAGVCMSLGYTLDDVCRMNLEKLASRKERGVIDGNGDNR